LIIYHQFWRTKKVRDGQNILSDSEGTDAYIVTAKHRNQAY